MSGEPKSDIDRRILAEFSEEQRELIGRYVVQETNEVTELMRQEFVRIIARMVAAAGVNGPLVRTLANRAIAEEERAITAGMVPV